MTHTPLLRTLIVFLLCTTAHGANVTLSDDQAIVQSVKHDLEQLAAVAPHWRERDGAKALRMTMDRLRAAPRDVVIPEVVRVLQEDLQFATGQARRSAYGLLRQHSAAFHDAGFEQLLRGVHDPDGVHAALEGLGLTPPARYPQLVATLAPLLVDEDLPELDLSRVMDLLGNTGNLAADALPKIMAIYADDEREEDTRVTAAQVAVRIGGVLYALEQFGLADLHTRSSFEAGAIVWAFARAGTETGGTFNIERPLRRIPRELILSALDHEDSDVRMAVAWALLVSYSEDEAVLKEGPDEYRIHPDIVGAFEKMMEEDADPDLREAAAETYFNVFPKWIERRRQIDKAKEAESENN